MKEGVHASPPLAEELMAAGEDSEQPPEHAHVPVDVPTPMQVQY